MSVLKNACTCWGLAKHLDCPSIQEWMWPGGISRVCVWLHPQREIFEMPMTSRDHWLFQGYFCLWSELRCSESKVVLVYSISIQLSLGIWNMEMCNSMFFPAKYCIQLGKERKKKNLKKQTNKKANILKANICSSLHGFADQEYSQVSLSRYVWNSFMYI